MLNNCVIVPANKSHANDMDTLNREELPEHYPLQEWQAILDREHFSYVAYCGDQIVGYILSTVLYYCFSIFKECHVASFAVRQDKRNQGIGTALLRESLKAMYDAGYRSCNLNVRVTNLEAQELYKRHGFRTISRVARYYRNDEDALVMEVQLSSSMFM